MSTPSTAELMLRMVVSLAIMGALLWLALKLAKSRKGGSILGAVGGSRTEHIEVRARRQLSRGATVALVRVGRRTFLLGLGEQGVQVLADGDDLDATVLEAPSVALDALAGPVPARPLEETENDRGHAGTRAPWTSGSGPSRMGVVDALRELTVRR